MPLRTNSLPILLVDDEAQLLKVSKLTLMSNDFKEVITVNDSREVLPLLASQQVGLIVLDLFMPHLSGLDLLPELVRNFPQVPVIVMTAMDETETAVKCMKTGAFDYLVKPVEAERLLTAVRKALEHRSMHDELDSLRERLFSDKLENENAFAAIITGSKKMRSVFQYMEVVANSRQPVLITGETGVGKELVAKAIHTLSGVNGSFVAINAAGLDDTMFSDSLFGHKKGAFTGADLAREGLIAKAAGGTLFLDEIGDLAEPSQIKLLRLLQEREYYPVGSDTPRKSDARLLLATNHDLAKQIDDGKFRRDLYYRLCAHRIVIPPLRERSEDIPLLLDHFLGLAAREFGKKKPTPPPELATLLATYHFPGNIRELEAMVHDAVARHASGIISMESFSNVIGEGRGHLKPQLPAVTEEGFLDSLFGHFPTLREIEDYLIAEGMKKANGNQGIAASLLGITRQTLNKRLRGADD
ncbi:MAG TPA: sigma-54 dependent transcriptional regulator [Geobacteraceae bacterium]